MKEHLRAIFGPFHSRQKQRFVAFSVYEIKFGIKVLKLRYDYQAFDATPVQAEQSRLLSISGFVRFRFLCGVANEFVEMHPSSFVNRRILLLLFSKVVAIGSVASRGSDCKEWIENSFSVFEVERIQDSGFGLVARNLPRNFTWKSNNKQLLKNWQI